MPIKYTKDRYNVDLEKKLAKKKKNKIKHKASTNKQTHANAPK